MTAPLPPFVVPAPLGVGDVISSAIRLLGRRPGMFFGLAAIPAGLGLALGVAIMAATTTNWLPLVIAVSRGDLSVLLGAMAVWGAIVLIGSIACALAQLYVVGLLTVLARETLHDRRPGLAELWQAMRGYTTRVIPLFLLGAAAYAAGVVVVAAPMLFGLVSVASPNDNQGALAAGVLLTILLGFVFLIALLFVVVRIVYIVPVISLTDVGPISALKRAWQLTSGAFWRTFGYLAVAYLVVYALTMVVGLVSQAFSAGWLAGVGTVDPLGGDFGRLFMQAMLPAIIGQFLVQLVSVPFLQSVVTVMYTERTGDLGWRHPATPAQWTAPQRWAAQPPTGYGVHQPPPGYGQPPYPAQPYGPGPYAQPPYGHPGYGQQPGYGQPYPPAGYPQPPYGASPYRPAPPGQQPSSDPGSKEQPRG